MASSSVMTALSSLWLMCGVGSGSCGIGFRIGKIIIEPEDEQINIPVYIYEDEEFITEAPLVTINYQASFNSSKSMDGYFDDAKEQAKKIIKFLNY